MKKISLYVVALLSLTLLLVVSLNVLPGSKVPVHAQVSCPYSNAASCLSGWAWSSNVGWISFNSNDDAGTSAKYDVAVDSSGGLSGYAWSSNVGWISFSPADLAVSPQCFSQTPAHVDLSTGAVSGWGRVISEEGRNDGWDGCIELSGINHQTGDLSGNGGVTYDKAASLFKGYAWTSVIGWLQFTPTLQNGGTTPTGCAGTTPCGGGTPDLTLQGSPNNGPLKGIFSSALVGVPAHITVDAAPDKTASVNIQWTSAPTVNNITATGNWSAGFTPTNNGTYVASYSNVTQVINQSFAINYYVQAGRGGSSYTKEVDVTVNPYSANQQPQLCTLPSHAISCNNDVGQPGSPTGALTCSTPAVTCQFTCDIASGYKLNAAGSACIRSSIQEI